MTTSDLSHPGFFAAPLAGRVVSSKPTSKNTRAFVAACALLGSTASALAADPLYQWNFNGADGSNSGTGSGGTLAANLGGATTGSFAAAGVSGAGGDSSLYTSNANDNWWGTDLGNAAAVSSLDLTSINQFTITMWVKRSGGNNSDLLNIGSTATPDSASNPGISIGLNGTWDNGIRVGVNGYNAWNGDLWSAGTDNDWVFLALAYDGTDTNNVWDNSTMNGLYGQHRNLAIITGDAVTGASVAGGMPLHTGDWATPVGNVSIGATATVYLGNNALGTAGFSGNLDDVRIYSGLLAVSEIEAVRASAIPEPSSYALALGLALFGGVAMRRRRLA